MSRVAGSLMPISREQAEATPLVDAWKNESIPQQQYLLTEAELHAWACGKPVPPFDAMRECLTGLSGSILEIGCGVGHYAYVISRCGNFKYTGIDYSETAIGLAKQSGGEFHVMDALRLDYENRSFDIVISGCVLLHIVDWRRALKEAARVAGQYLILHRTPVSDEPTRYFFKKAYGVTVVEIWFNKADLIAETEAHGFTLTKTFPVTQGQETLLFERTLFHHPV